MKRLFLSVLLVSLLAPLPGYAAIPPAHLLLQLKTGDYAGLDKLITSQQYAYETSARNEIEILQTLNTFQSSNDGLEEQLNKWVAHNPDSYPAYLARGSHYVHIASLLRGTKLGKNTHKQQFSNMRRYHARALEDFNTALSFNPKLMYAYSMLIRIATSSGTWADIGQLADDGLKVDPASYLVHRQIMFKFQPKWGGSTTAIKKWIELKIKPQLKNNSLLQALLGYPDYVKAETQRFKKKNLKLAESYYSKAVNNSTGDYNVLFLFERGHYYFSHDKYEPALNDLNKALEQYPYYVSALRIRGRTLDDMKRYDEALRDLNLAVSLDEYNPKLRRARAYLHKDLGMHKEDLADINAALKYGSYDSHNWRAKGYILLYKNNDFPGAEQAFSKAVELDPDNEGSWYELGVAQYKQLSCDFMTPMEVYIEMCKKKKCEKSYVEWSKSTLKMAIDKGYCEKMKTADPG